LLENGNETGSAGAFPFDDISPDGPRFLMIKENEQTEEASAPTQLIIVLNWFEELKRLELTGE